MKHKYRYQTKAARLRAQRKHVTRGMYQPLEWGINGLLDALEATAGRLVDATAKALAAAWRKYKKD